MLATIKFAKVKENAVIPTKRLEDAGLDMYACFDEDFILIPPHETVMIPTGIACALDVDYCIVLKERGSTGTKGMGQRAGIIDSGFRGEIKCPITNENDFMICIHKKDTIETTGNESTPTAKEFCLTANSKGEKCLIYPYEKAICQALVVPVPEVDIEEYTYDELKAIPSERGTGMLGSSNK